jgi:hypothetical protein
MAISNNYASVADVISQVEFRLVDVDDDAYTDDNIVAYLNDAQRDLSESMFYVVEEEVTPTAGVVAFSALSYPARRVFGVELGGVRLYSSPSHEMLAQASNVENPTWYAVNGGNIKLSSQYADTIKVIYAGIPSDVTATDNLDTRVAPYGQILSAFIEFRIRLSEQDFQGADRAAAEYSLGKQALVTESRDNFISGGYGA